MDRNVTRYALLGLLTLRPGGATGYELRRLAERSIGYFWNESYGQIYPALKQLRKEGLVTARAEAEGKRDRIVYGLTAAGRKRLRKWLEAGARAQPPRNEALLKLFFGPEVSPEVNAGRIRELREHHRGLLARYDAVEQQIRSAYGGEPGLPYWLMTLDYGRRHSRMALEWSEATLRKLEQMGAGKTRRKPK
jgi:DNA-binding PadR family transcriptional regulator